MIDLNQPTGLAQSPVQAATNPTVAPTAPEPLTFDPKTFEDSTGFASPYAPAEFVDATPIGPVAQFDASDLAAPVQAPVAPTQAPVAPVQAPVAPLAPIQPPIAPVNTQQSNPSEATRVELVDSIANTNQSAQIQQAPIDTGPSLATPPPTVPQAKSKPEFNTSVGQYKPNQGLQIKQASSPQFLGSIAMAQSIMKNKTLNLDPQQSAQFGEYSTAFNNKGELVPNGMDANGIQTIRGIDAQGNLGIAKVDAQGKIKPQGIINLDQMQEIISKKSQELTR